MPDISVPPVQLTRLSQFHNPMGSVGHLLKSTDATFFGFGEAYITRIHFNRVKAWKRHSRQVMNLVVLTGHVRFVFRDVHSPSFISHDIGAGDNIRITVQPMLWFGFKGLCETGSSILNLSSIVHDPEEVESIPINSYDFHW